MKKLLVFAIAILGFSAVSFGQTSASVSNASATATVLQPLAMTNPQALIFGTFAAHATLTKEVILDAANSRGTSTAVLYEVGAIAKSGVFHITGTPNASFAFTLPTGTTTLTGPGAAVLTIAPASWVTDLGAYTVLTGSLSTLGVKDLSVGATLSVPAAASAGNYSATYAVTVNYN